MISHDQTNDSHQPEEATPEQPSAAEPAAAVYHGPGTINIRNLSVRCGRCNQYQVLVGFAHLDEEWNLYTYECESEPCAADVGLTRTFLEVPAELDEFANRDPSWRGGAKFAGA